MILYSSFSCWSRGTAPPGTTQRILCSWRITCTTQTTPHVSSCPGMVLERALLPSSSGYWCPASLTWLWTWRTVTPAPLRTQRPVNYHPAIRNCLSPQQTESQSLLRSLSHQERQSWRSSRSQSPKYLTRCESRQHKRGWTQLWRSWGLWKDPPTAPPLGVSTNRTWEI